jgi:hypothetical protein
MKKSDVSLLIGLLGVIIGFCGYWFGWRNLTAQVEEYQAKNAELRTEIARRTALEENREMYVNDAQTYAKTRAEIVSKYPSGYLPEDDIKFAYSSEREEGADYTLINGIAFSDAYEVYTTTNTTTDPTTGETVSSSEYPSYTLCEAVTSTTLETSYEGLKEMVRKIYAEGDYKTMESVSVGYNIETGMLTGSMVMDTFYVLGTDKPYSQPNLMVVPTGTDNIFGTYEPAEAEATEEGAAEAAAE